MSIKKRIIFSIFCLLIVCNVCANSHTVYAATKQAEIITLEDKKDLVVMFSFDNEVVDITFISPSGTRKNLLDSDVEYGSGELWCTYRILNAEAGTWSLEYDLKNNSEINYSIIEDDYGLWIQYLNVTDISKDEAKVTFEADCESETIYYGYEIYAVSTTDESVINKLAEGNEKSNEENEIEINLSSLSSDNYILRLDVYYKEGEAELFDTAFSDPFEYNNPNEPKVIEDFKTFVDINNLSCEVDWSDYSNWGYDGYRLVVYENGEVVYTGDLENNINSNVAMFSVDATELQINLYYKDNDIWSTPKVKTINLQDEFLKMTSNDVIGTGQVTLGYQTKSERSLYVKINDEEGSYKVTDVGSLYFDLTEGTNTVYSEMECDDLIWFIIDSNVYYDTNPPSIKLYENIDGKTFYTDDANIIGKVTGCNKLIINEEEISVNEQGEFNYLVNLSLGENIIDIEATDINGNASKMVLTLYKASKIVNGNDAKTGWIQFLPLVASVLTSLLIIIISLLFMKKKDKIKNKIKGEKKYRVWPFIIWDIFLLIVEGGYIWAFINHYLYSNSMSYLELAEKSASEAAEYLRVGRIFVIASGVGVILLVVSIIISIIVCKKAKSMRNVLRGNE